MFREELKVRSIGYCAMLEEDAMHIAYRDGSRHICIRTRHKRKEDSTAWATGHRSSLERHTNPNMEEDGLR